MAECKHNLPTGCCMVCAHERRMEQYRQGVKAGITPEPARRDDGSIAPPDGWAFGEDKFNWHRNQDRLGAME